MGMIIDPYLFCLPINDNLDLNKSIDFIKQLQKWEVEFINNPTNYSISEAALITMQRLGISPTPDNLIKLWKKFSITEFSFQDIAPTCSGVLVNSERLEEKAGIYDAYSEAEIIEGNETVIPEEIRLRLHPEVAIEFIHSLLYTAYMSRKEGHNNGWSVVTAPFPAKYQVNQMTTEAALRTLNEDDTFEKVDISYIWPLLFDPEHVYASLQITEMLKSSDLCQVVEVTRCRLKSQGNELPQIDYSKIIFHKRFLETVLEQRILRRPNFKEDINRIFEGMVFSILNVWQFGSDKHHSLNKNITLRNSEERTRKSKADPSRRDKGARIEALGGPTPLHIHYWRCVNGVFEFSNITDSHNDPTIYE